MALVEPSVMLNSIMGKLYNILTNGDDTVPRSEDNFFSWATPGIPIMPEDFEFLSQGLTGIVKKAPLQDLVGGPPGAAGAPATPPAEITPAMLEGLRAQDTARLYMQAENFSRLVDFVPDVAANTNNQFAAMSVMNNEGTLSDRYEYILRMSQVMQTELPEDIKKKIEKFRLLLATPTKVKNLMDDTETDGPSVPSQMSMAYNRKMKEFNDAALEYNSRRIDALTADNVKAIHFWSINANILRNSVKAAMDEWVASGFKNDVEAISAFIDQVMRRDMALLKRQYLDDLEKARLTGMASGSDFFYSSLVPGNFMQSSGWTEFGFSSSDFGSSSNSSYSLSRSSSSGGGGYFGIFGATGSHSTASGSSASSVKFDSSNFSMGFKITQVPIVRPWFKSAFLNSKSWRFDQGNPEAKSQMVSNGAKPPTGLICAYPTSLIAVKDLWISFAKSSGFNEMNAEWQSSSTSGGGYIAFGPWHLGGKHSRSSASGSRSSSYHYDAENQMMRVDGAQVIGFKCHLPPKSPDPLASITQWI